MQRYLITIQGRVQGIGFRFSAMEMAYRHDIKGFVKNKGADMVYLEAEGETENLEKFLTWCKKGPIGAKVEKLTYTEAPPHNFNSFEIMARNYEVN